MAEKSFFASFPVFNHDPTAAISEEFYRLGEQRGWKKGSKTWRRQWKNCMNREYDRLIGKKMVGLADWNALCLELGLKVVYPSITQCKVALSKVHVNLVDLLDSRVNGTKVKKFPNLKALREYTFRTEKYFRRDVIKQDKLLKVLLRRLT